MERGWACGKKDKEGRGEEVGREEEAKCQAEGYKLYT